jgi:thioredoxin 1
MKGNFKEIINSDIPVLVDFYADWCGPCKALAPILEQVKAELGDDVKIIKINTDENPDLSMEYSIRSIPTMIVFKNGQGVERVSGVLPKDKIVEMINKHI